VGVVVVLDDMIGMTQTTTGKPNVRATMCLFVELDKPTGERPKANEQAWIERTNNWWRSRRSSGVLLNVSVGVVSSDGDLNCS